jgi:hypothetical protein
MWMNWRKFAAVWRTGFRLWFEELDVQTPAGGVIFAGLRDFREHWRGAYGDLSSRRVATRC